MTYIASNSTHRMCINYALDLLINTIDFHPGHNFKKFSMRGNWAASTSGKHFRPAAHFVLYIEQSGKKLITPKP